jgi:hypothetical protein
MKYNKLFVVGIASLALLSSCQDAYDIRQSGEVNNPDKVYNTIGDFELGLNGVYQVFSPDKTIEFTSIFTDEVAIGLTNGGQGINDGQYQFQLTSGSDAAISIWQSNYTLINFANRIIAYKDRVKQNILDSNNGDETSSGYQEDIARYNDVVGQLYAIRAFAHFQLVSWFSTDPSDLDALGVMKFDFVPDYEYKTLLPRVKNRDIYELIESDLDIAETAFTDAGVTSVQTKVGPKFIQALQARMALYRKDYATAIAKAQAAIGTYTTTLANSATTYYNQWSDVAATDFIFKVVRVNGDFGIGSYWNTQESSITGSPFFEVSRGLFNSYTVSTDIRNAFFTPSGGTRTGTLVDGTSIVSPNPDAEADYVNNDVLVVNKYPGNEAQSDNLLNDVKVFSNGEMVLIIAEALANQDLYNGPVASTVTGTPRNTQEAISRLRKRRFAAGSYVAPAYASKQAALADVQLERRRELAFMGHRYLDIKRLGPVTGQSVDRYSRDCEPYSACTLEATSYKFTLPIPSTELTANPNIRSQQNPGY